MIKDQGAAKIGKQRLTRAEDEEEVKRVETPV
jgi:hypothetical protein